MRGHGTAGEAVWHCPIPHTSCLEQEPARGVKTQRGRAGGGACQVRVAAAGAQQEGVTRMVAGEGWVRGGVCAARVKNVGDSDKGGGVEPQHRSGSCTARSYWCHDRAESPETAQAGTHCGSHRRQCLPVPQGPVPDRYQQPAVTLHQPGGTQRGGRPHRRMSKAGSAGKSWGRGVPGRIIGSGRPVGGGSESGSGRWAGVRGE